MNSTKGDLFCPECHQQFEKSDARYCCQCGSELKPQKLQVEPVRGVKEDKGVAKSKCPTYVAKT